MTRLFTLNEFVDDLYERLEKFDWNSVIKNDNYKYEVYIIS